uniref:Anaphase-promoting complex subunit 4 WD40 domain-containing protein n=2 Tax=Ditylum brightwellii TaxID=49249 RepID=A0A6S8ZI71_9STRA|mmetsp:Transcript_12325/g.18266  ORF Transcript_12325/g.18266 Transcript_12325/m.18266 type:complete len:717 (+) Transcript_12325:74-2224(+)
MSSLEVDASNCCIPPICPLISHNPPLPTSIRGEPCVLDGKVGRWNKEKSGMVMYASGRLIVIRELDDLELGGCGGTEEKKRKVKAFVYRGHTAQVTAAKFSESGCYVASGDIRGRLRVWSYDNEEHLCKLELPTALAGPIRDISWDADNRRICIVGESSKTDSSSPCCRVIQWDTGVTCGDLGVHARGRASSCAFKPGRPMRIVTAGTDDARCMFHKGPPFQRLLVDSSDGTSSEYAHTRGAVHCVRYDAKGEQMASVGTDRSVCFYDGKTMDLKGRIEDVHTGTIYSCAFDSSGKHLLTTSADGTAAFIDAIERKVLHTWNIADHQKSIYGVESDDKVPMGAMQKACAFLSDDTPISISHNGHIAVLPYPSDLLSNASRKTEKMCLVTGHQAPIDAFTINHETDTMYTVDSDGIVVEWQASNGHALSRFAPPAGTDTDLSNKIHTGAITSVVALDRDTVLTTAWDDTLKISTKVQSDSGNVNSAMQVTQSLSLQAQPNGMTKGTNLVVILTVKGLLLYHNSTISSDIISLPFEPTSICLSNDDTTLYVGAQDCKIYIYTVNITSSDNPLEEKHVIQDGHLKSVHALSLSNDETKLASADSRDVCVWDVTTPDYTAIVSKSRWCFHTQKITCIAWSNDDSFLASGGGDDSIYLWSLAKKIKRVHFPFAHRGGITGLTFLKTNEDGEEEKRMILASVGIDACVNHWDVTDDVAKKFG